MVVSIQILLNQWEAAGVFDFVLPFLLIFAVIYGILSATNIMGNNKGVHLVVSLVIGLLALRLEFVQLFFRELFPRFGIALAVILVVVILAAMFIPKEHMGGWLIGFGVAGAVFALIAVINSFNALGWFGTAWWDQYWPMTVGAILLIIVIVAIFVSGRPPGAKGIPISLPITPIR